MTTPRPFVCLDCRTRLGADDPCDCKNGQKARRVDLSTPTGRRALVGEVWGSASAKRLRRDAARAGATGAGVGGASNLLDCVDCGSSTGSSTSAGGCENLGDAFTGDAAVFLLVIVVAAIAFVVLYFLIRWIVRAINEYRNRPRPHGALVRLPPFLGSGVNGRVLGPAADATNTTNTTEASPSGVACLAWTCELHHRRVLGEGAMLRDGWTSGFEIELDDRRRVRIPAGRVRLEEPARRVDDDDIRRAGYLRELDPQAVAGMPPNDDPFPFDHADERYLRADDRVELLNPLTLQIDPSLDTAYREASGALVPEGVPLLRVRQRVA